MVVVSVQHTGAAAVNDCSTFTLFQSFKDCMHISVGEMGLDLWGQKRGIVVFWVCCGKSPNKPLLKNRIVH